MNFIVFYSFSRFLENTCFYYAAHTLYYAAKEAKTHNRLFRAGFWRGVYFFLLRRHSAEAKPLLKGRTFPARYNKKQAV